MKRFFGLLIICSLLLSGFGVMADPLPPPESENLVTHPVYLPLLRRSGGGSGATFTVSGAVKDVDQYPVANVIITDVHGAVAVTDIQGKYSINVEAGANTLTAARSGYDIAPVNLNVNSNLAAVNFTAQVGCGSIVVNETLNVGMGGWDFLTDQPDHVIPGTDTLVFRSPSSSGRVGINPGVDDNVASTTRARSQVYHIPSDADAVFLGLWVTQTLTVAGEFDRFYIDILEGNTINNVYYSSVSTVAWTYVEFPLDNFRNKDIKIQIRVMNSGGSGYATMYFDDVMLIICNTHCEDQIVNGGFESQSPNPAISGWLYIGPQLAPPMYTAAFFHTGLWSMRVGIPTAGTDMEAFTEVFQRNIDLPSSHSGAMLTFWLLTTRTDGIVPPIEPRPPADFGSDREVPFITGRSSSPLALTATPEEDWWYVYVYDDDGNYLDRLMWEKTIDSKNTWLRYRFDLSDFMGQKIQLLFGTYNDGRGGPSAVYVDDVVLGTCD